MGLVLGQSLMVISVTSTLLVSALYNVLWECIVVYKHFDRSLHIGPSDPTCVQNFRPVPLTVFEILGFNQKNQSDNKKNWRNVLFAISPMLVVQF